MGPGQKPLSTRFRGGDDGSEPYARLIGRGNVLYGTTWGGNGGKSTVFSLSNNGGSWHKRTLHIFTGGSSDGDESRAGLYMDVQGNLFGTTEIGGLSNNGTVFELSATGAAWIETILYSFNGGSDGRIPLSALALGANGSLYGTTNGGGQYGRGTVFALSFSAGQWEENVIHSFGSGSDAAEPFSGVTALPNGSLLGAATLGGDGNCIYSQCGAIYEVQ